MQLGIRPIRLADLGNAFVAFQAAHTVMRAGKSHPELSVDIPDPIEAERVPIEGVLPPPLIAQPRFVEWAQSYHLTAVFAADGSVTVGSLTAQPGQWVALGPEGPYVIAHVDVADHLQKV